MRRFLVLLSLLAPMPVSAAEPFKLKDGDRVVFVGSTLIEREQRYGYWETALTSEFPRTNITFRNLGWSGDTVWGEARASFDAPAIGYKRLVEQTLALKPTLLIIGYGSNESFAGKEGLEPFRKQFDKLLDDLTSSKARAVLLAPPLVERKRWLGGDADQRDRDIKLYSEAIKQIADRRQAHFVADICQACKPEYPLTENGIHLTAYGYWRTALKLVDQVNLDPDSRPLGIRSIELRGQTPFQLRQKMLEQPPVPLDSEAKDISVDCRAEASFLAPGKYTLKIDGHPVHTADAAEWLKPKDSYTRVPKGPSLDQAEKLRQTIVEKNQLFFHRYRPQNETYLFGFRKHEQGQNAKEIAQFDPLIEKLEKEIARLRVPVEHTYVLIPEREEKK